MMLCRKYARAPVWVSEGQGRGGLGWWKECQGTFDRLLGEEVVRSGGISGIDLSVRDDLRAVLEDESSGNLVFECGPQALDIVSWTRQSGNSIFANAMQCNGRTCSTAHIHQEHAFLSISSLRLRSSNQSLLHRI